MLAENRLQREVPHCDSLLHTTNAFAASPRETPVNTSALRPNPAQCIRIRHPFVGHRNERFPLLRLCACVWVCMCVGVYVLVGHPGLSLPFFFIFIFCVDEFVRRSNCHQSLSAAPPTCVPFPVPVPDNHSSQRHTHTVTHTPSQQVLNLQSLGCALAPLTLEFISLLHLLGIAQLVENSNKKFRNN